MLEDYLNKAKFLEVSIALFQLIRNGVPGQRLKIHSPFTPEDCKGETVTIELALLSEDDETVESKIIDIGPRDIIYQFDSLAYKFFISKLEKILTDMMQCTSAVGGFTQFIKTKDADNPNWRLDAMFGNEDDDEESESDDFNFQSE